MRIRHWINRLASKIYFATMSEYTLRKTIPIARKWSRKGNCPVCMAGCGCNHRKGCVYKLNES